MDDKIWAHRWLLWAMVQRDLRTRYTGSVLGAAWSLLQPLIMLGIYAVLFQTIFRVRLGDVLPAETPFVVFVALALWPWLLFQEGVMRGLRAVVQQGALIKKVAFPHRLVVYSAVLSSVFLHLVGFVAVILVLAIAGISFRWVALPWLLLAVAVLAMAATGLALVLGSLQVFVRDTEEVVGQCTTIAFYLTPILYPMVLVPGWLQRLIQLNPLLHILDPPRALLLGHGWPPTTSIWMALLAVSLAVGLWIFGHRVFQRLSPYFEDAL